MLITDDMLSAFDRTRISASSEGFFKKKPTQVLHRSSLEFQTQEKNPKPRGRKPIVVRLEIQ